MFVWRSKKIALDALNDAQKFLSERRWERLRQARNSFNAALVLVVGGTIVLLAGVIFVYLRDLTIGIVTSAAGTISDFTGALLFKLSSDANERLDKISLMNWDV